MRIRERYEKTVRYPYLYGLTPSEVDFKKNLAFLRGLTGLTKNQLIIYLDVDRSYYYKLEDFKKHMSPSFEWFEILADFYGLDVYMLLYPNLENALTSEDRSYIKKTVLEKISEE